jgi:hypothetical protein
MLGALGRAVVTLLVAAIGCTDSSGDGEPGAPNCNAGCLCYAVDACPSGCYVSQTEQANGSASASFCSNGIVQCVPSGVAWSVGTPANNCPTGPTTYLTGGPAPKGSFCCDYQSSEDGGADTGSDGEAELDAPSDGTGAARVDANASAE